MPRRKSINSILLIALFVISAVSCLGQSTTGTVTMSATVSKFVEINSGGAVTLTGNSGGGVTTDGVNNSPLAVSINLGELGPSNTNSFVTAQVPLKLRSNAAYVLSMAATVTSSGTSGSRIVASDVGFGLGTVSRTGLGVNAGADTNATSGDPTLFRRSDAGRERFCKRHDRPLRIHRREIKPRRLLFSDDCAQWSNHHECRAAQ